MMKWPKFFQSSVIVKCNYQTMPMALNFELNIVQSTNFCHYILRLVYNDDLLIIF